MATIKKISENNIEVTRTKTVKDINGVDFEILDRIDSYGQERVDQEKASTEADLASINDKTATQYQDAQKLPHEDKLAELVLIQAEIDKV